MRTLLKVNHHLTKTYPQYKVLGKRYKVKLLQVRSANSGLVFTAEILNGKDKGKWTTVCKNNLVRLMEAS